MTPAEWVWAFIVGSVALWVIVVLIGVLISVLIEHYGIDELDDD